MKIRNIIITAWLLLSLSQYSTAQQDTIRIEGKNQKKVVILEPGEESSIVLKDSNSTIEMDIENSENEDGTKSIEWTLPDGKIKMDKKDNYSINFLSDFSFGYATASNLQSASGLLSLYEIPALNNGFNFSMNILKQEINLVKHQLYLTTAFGINNYYFNVTNERLVPNLNVFAVPLGPAYGYSFDSLNGYETNRVDSRFLSVPIMLKWKPKTKKQNGKVGLAAGVEFNFRNRLFAKMRIDENGKEQSTKLRLPSNANEILPSYIVRAQYGSVGIFARMTSETVTPLLGQRNNNFTLGISTKF